MAEPDNYILLVEDNPDDVELTILAFKKNNFANEIKVVEDGEEAIHFLSGKNNEGISKFGYPELILLDLKLPKVNGHEVLKEIKADKKTKRIPVVILTSSQEEEDIIKGYDLGANSYVRKPVDYQDFVEVVNNLGVYWLAINKNII
ncbi:response regulator [Rhodohalobacter sulfatireducens]|uniref:Response regulator n=1 Tax=Rhodohalobacter sulfatireducens TaxID=2911366 RepID=A0ABS9KJ05_9BACT|nr:response regulator [Rhodohalobacter sulfatireducens]MCG2590845.1 response regulator [Rhodohalobacter sulfatireducens]